MPFKREAITPQGVVSKQKQYPRNARKRVLTIIDTRPFNVVIAFENAMQYIAQPDLYDLILEAHSENKIPRLYAVVVGTRIIDVEKIEYVEPEKIPHYLCEISTRFSKLEINVLETFYPENAVDGSPFLRVFQPETIIYVNYVRGTTNAQDLASYLNELYADAIRQGFRGPVTVRAKMIMVPLSAPYGLGTRRVLVDVALFPFKFVVEQKEEEEVSGEPLVSGEDSELIASSLDSSVDSHEHEEEKTDEDTGSSVDSVVDSGGSEEYPVERDPEIKIIADMIIQFQKTKDKALGEEIVERIQKYADERGITADEVKRRIALYLEKLGEAGSQ
ncbi:MAG: hypothetical protein GXO43_05835 [Crenarchaeota archaeon]|nr:hypothetical protein [Thermoproteota archaeon]